MRDPNVSDLHDMIRWCFEMAHAFQRHRAEYEESAKRYILEALESEMSQVARARLERQLRYIGVRDNQGRKERWTAYYRGIWQCKVARYIRSDPDRAQRYIARLAGQA